MTRRIFTPFGAAALAAGHITRHTSGQWPGTPFDDFHTKKDACRSFAMRADDAPAYNIPLTPPASARRRPRHIGAVMLGAIFIAREEGLFRHYHATPTRRRRRFFTC